MRRRALPSEPPVLIVGVPRSGTTWVAHALSLSAGAVLVHEPDNHGLHPRAFALKRGLGRFPALLPGQEHSRYERLWRDAFTGHVDVRPDGSGVVTRAFRRTVRGRHNELVEPGARRSMAAVVAAAARPPRTPPQGRLVVKSVHVCCSLSWLLERWQPEVVLVRRDPLDVVASWRETIRKSGPVEPVAEEVGEVTTVLAQAAVEHGIPPVWHEDLCADPVARLQTLAARVGLEWTDAATEFVEQSNRPGTGFELERVASEQSGRWRERLTADEAERARGVLDRFPLAWRA
jgi:hypothetical protein